MLIDFVLGATSIMLRVKLRQDTTGAKPGNGITALTSSSAGLIISTIADNEASATTYTQAGSTIEAVTTLGTFAAPTATKCRFKKVDDTNHPGIYEIQIADARFGVSSARFLLISISGVSGMSDCDVVIPLRAVNPYDGVRGGMTALPNAAANAAGGLPVSSAGALDLDEMNVDIEAIQASTAGLTFTGAGKVDASVRDWVGDAIPARNVTGVPLVDAKYLLGTIFATPATAGIMDVNAKNWGNSVVTGMPMPTYAQPTGFLAATFPTGTVANTTNITAGTIATVTTVTNQLTAAQIATGVWQDTTAGDFTTASSIGKSLFTSGAAPGAAGGLFIAGTNAATTVTTSFTTTFTGNLTGSIGSVTGAVGSVTAGVTLAASQHVIVDSGTVTTLTNLPSIPANWLTATGIAAAALNGKGDWLLSSSYTAPTNPTDYQQRGVAVTLPAAPPVGFLVAASYGTAPAWYTAPDNADVVTALADLVTLLARTDPTTALTALTATAAAVKAKTDNLGFTVPGSVDANLRYVNGSALNGAGTAASPWGPV